MKPKEQELMERYIYQVVRRLPKEQRREVGLELQELIADMMEATGSMEEVLSKLGDPAEFAKKYQDSDHYLIGPEYYDNYIWFVKIVLICTLIPVLAVGIIEAVREGAGLTEANLVQAIITSVIYGIVNGIVNILISCIGAFGGVTLMFAMMERYKIKFDMKKQKAWSVSDLGDDFTGKKEIWTPNYLSPVPHQKALIRRSDSIVSIVFIVIFCVLLIFAPQFFGAILKSGDGIRIVPVFNLSQWYMILPVFVLILVIELANEIFRLVVGHYDKLVMISTVVSSFIQMVLTFIIFKVFPLWNPNFVTELQIGMGDRVDGASDYIARWNGNLVSNFLFVCCLLATFLEVGTTIYKTLRYGTDKHSGS